MRVHRHVFARDDVALDQDAADRRVGMAVVRVVIDAQQRAVGQPHARRALDLDEQEIVRVLEITDLQIAGRERAVLDLRAVEIRRVFAARDAAHHAAAVGEALRLALAPHVDEVARAAVKRHLEVVGLDARAVDDRLVIAGEKAVRIVDFRNTNRAEILLEKLARRLGRQRAGGACLAADLDQRRINRPRVARHLGAADDADGSLPEMSRRRPRGRRPPSRRPRQMQPARSACRQSELARADSACR